jgi:anti-sigma-K factor RskA
VKFLPRRDQELHSLAGAYALNALDGDERDRFEQHLHGCRACADEVRGFTATVTAMGMAAASEPPPGLKNRVLAATSVTRQLPPVTGEDRSARSARPARATRGARQAAPRRAPAQRSPWIPRVALGVGAAGFAAAAALSVVTITTQHQLDSAQAGNAAIAAVLGAPDAQIMSQATSAGGTATVVASVREGTMVFTSSGLADLPPQKVYELWFLSPGNARRAGLVPPATGDATAPVLASGLKPGDKVGVTVEPAGGSNAPTTTPIVVMTV